jgi:hypothetical protein
MAWTVKARPRGPADTHLHFFGVGRPGRVIFDQVKAGISPSMSGLVMSELAVVHARAAVPMPRRIWPLAVLRTAYRFCLSDDAVSRYLDHSGPTRNDLKPGCSVGLAAMEN